MDLGAKQDVKCHMPFFIVSQNPKEEMPCKENSDSTRLYTVIIIVTTRIKFVRITVARNKI